MEVTSGCSKQDHNVIRKPSSHNSQIQIQQHTHSQVGRHICCAPAARTSAYWVSAGFSAAFRRASSASNSAMDRLFRAGLAELAGALSLSPS
jgi:hypothetical protein